MDLQNPKSWFTLEPDPRPHEEPLKFKPDEIKAITQYDDYSTSRAGLYSATQIKKFWEKIVSQRRGEGILKALVNAASKYGNRQKHSRPEYGQSFDPNIHGKGYQIGKIFEKDWMKNQFIELFGATTYYFTLAGTWFASCMLVTYVVSFGVKTWKAWRLYNIIGTSVHWTRIILDSFFNTLMIISDTGKDDKEKLIEKTIPYEHSNYSTPNQDFYPKITAPDWEQAYKHLQAHNEIRDQKEHLGSKENTSIIDPNE